MSKCVLLIGPVCAGKTKLAETLIEKGFLKNKSNFYGIEQSRKLISDGTMAGELDAWAAFLRQIQSPASNDNAIYEFSGTGRHVYSVCWAMEHSVKENSKNEWLVVYCLAPDNVIEARFPNKVYDAPFPFNMGSPLNSVTTTKKELKELYEKPNSWNRSPSLAFNTDVENYNKIADDIIAFFNK